ncbi:MAG: ACT domain-containing protein [Acidimicrobiia bacterium]
MNGERDLSTILSTLDVIRRPGTYVYVSPAHQAVPGAVATIVENEATTSIVELETAERLELEWTFPSAWLTIDVRTALDGVGLTAAVSTALAEAGIACNMLAGRYHDHLLVPVGRADDAIAVLLSLRTA